MLAGCYLLQAAGGQMAVMAERRPIAAVLADPRTTPDLKTRLEYVSAAREFASRELNLPDNGSYREYADIGRRYVVWNVFATAPFSIEPRRWCFPIAGCVVYRGYFSERGAQRYAARLQGRGDDVAIAGVAAYSTLGHFTDPVLNTMLGWSDAQLAGTLFHELAHQLLYVRGDSAFNEAFASVVEEEGVRRWLHLNDRESELTAWELQRHRAAEFSDLLLDAREQLGKLYASGLPPAETRYRKQLLFGDLKFRYSQLRLTWGGYAGYDAWFARPLNNADLVTVATYRRCMPGLRRLLEAEGGDLDGFYARARDLARLTAKERNDLLCAG